MSFTQLLTLELPRPTGRSLKRQLKTTKLKTKRYIKASIRKARSRTIAAIRRQYFITSAATDLRAAVRRNEDIYISAAILAVVISYATVSTIADFVLLFFQASYQIADASGANMAVLLMIMFSVVTLLVSWIASFLLNLLSFATIEGAMNKKNRSTRLTIRKSLHLATRTTIAWYSFCLAIVVPLILAGVGGLLYLHYNPLSVETLMDTVAPKVIVGIITYLAYMLMQYSLAPYVAIFEPTLKLRKTFGRSRELVERRGRVFILTGYYLLGAAIYGAYITGAWMEKIFELPQIVTVSFLTILLLMFANSIMVTLYRKRKMARTN